MFGLPILIMDAPQLRPPPIAVKPIKLPLKILLVVIAFSKAKGIEAAEVLP
jgi:hypothetical protein